MDRLSVELKQTAEKLFQVKPCGSPEGETTSYDAPPGESQSVVQNLEHREKEATQDTSSDIEKENTERMGQLSVELKEAAEKLFAVDPLGSSERDLSSSDTESSDPESSSGEDDQSDASSVDSEDSDEVSENTGQESESDSDHSECRQGSVESVKSESNVESERNATKFPSEEFQDGELFNSMESNGKESQIVGNEDCSKVMHDKPTDGVYSCEKRDKIESIEKDHLCLNSENECTLLITDVRSESVDFHQNENETIAKAEVRESVTSKDNVPSGGQACTEESNSTPHSNPLINLEENETCLVVENVYSLSERPENTSQNLPHAQDDSDVCENNITSRSLRDRKALAKAKASKTNGPPQPKKRRRMKKTMKANSQKEFIKADDDSIFKPVKSDDFNSLPNLETENNSRLNSDDVGEELEKKDKMAAYTLREDGQFKCLFCSCIISTKARFKLHILRLHNKKYTCRHCGKNFLKCQDLAIHVKTRHVDALKYKVCKTGEVKSIEKNQHKSKQFTKKCTLIKTKDNGELTYACGYCDEIFDKQQSLACHIRNKHVLPNNSGKIVYQKSGKFKRKSKKNLIPEITGENENVTIESPMKKVRTNESLCNLEDEENHEKTEYRGKGPRRATKASLAAESGLEKIAKLQEDYNIRISHQTFRCRHCPKWFFKKAELTVHMQKHKGEKRKWKEEIEENTKNLEDVANKGTDETHQRSVNPDVFCKYCTSKYKSLDNLKIHIVQHLGEFYKEEMTDSKLECAFCGCNFHNVNCSNIGKIMSHLFDHFSPETRDIDPYNLIECQYCGIPFLSMEKLLPHENEHRKFLETKNPKKIMKREELDNRTIVKDTEAKEKTNSALDTVEDPVPFTCGMCSSRFPTSQYLLHHMTLHMKGKYVFRVEVDKSKATQESPPVTQDVETTNQQVRSLSPRVPILVKATSVAADEQLTSAQHISALVQDRIQTMLRKSVQVGDGNRSSTSSKNTKLRNQTSATPKPRMELVPLTSKIPSIENTQSSSRVQTTVNDAPHMHNYARPLQVTRNFVSIITKQPIQPNSLDSPESSNASTTSPNKHDSEMNKNKRKQTFRASEIKADFEFKPVTYNIEVVKNNRRKQTFRRVSETDEDESVELPPIHRAQDLMDCSSTETAEDDASDYTNNEGEAENGLPARQGSKYKEVSDSSESKTSSDSASDFERDWKSRYYNKKKKISRKKKRRGARKRSTNTRQRPLSESSRGWKRKINFVDGKWFECSLCLYKCTGKKKYLTHLKTHESVDLEGIVQCNICHRKFMSKWHLQIHKTQHRSNEYQCSFCGMDFATSSAIVNHIDEVHNQVDRANEGVG